jgi:hypothetical protein
VTSGGRLWIPMEDMDGDIGPEFTKGIRRCVTEERIAILARDLLRGTVLLRVVGSGYALCDSAPQQLGCVDRVVAVIVRCDRHPAHSL